MRKTSCPLLSESERALSPKIRIIRWGGVGEVHRVEVYRSWKVLLPFAFKEFNKADDYCNSNLNRTMPAMAKLSSLLTCYFVHFLLLNSTKLFC